jgi:NodT family efflux transporter outer membrane factor (OMF) lipoprotein
MLKRLKILYCCIFFLSLLAACSHTHEKKTFSALTLDELEPQSREVPNLIKAQWWTELQDDQLNNLVNLLLTSAPTAIAAKNRIDAAEEILNSEKSRLRPSVGLSGQAGNERLSQNYMFIPGMPVTTSYGSIGASMHWSLDIWGKQQKVVDAAGMGFQATKAESLFTQLWLTATLVQTYSELDSAWRRLEIADEKLNAYKQLIEIANQRKQSGMLDDPRLNQTRMEIDIAQVELNQANVHKLVLQHLIAAMVGKGPSWGESLQRPNFRASFSEIPRSIPVNLISRRADLVAFDAQVKMSGFQFESAKLSYLPDISLQALSGYQAFDITRLLQQKSKQTSIAPTFSVPLYEGGAIDALVGLKHTQLNEAILNYNKAVLDALKESADGLVKANSARENLQLISNFCQRSSRIHQSNQEKRSLGMVSQEQLLRSAINDLNSQIQLTDARQQYIVEHVRLIHALGGPFAI